MISEKTECVFKEFNVRLLWASWQATKTWNLSNTYSKNINFKSNYHKKQFALLSFHTYRGLINAAGTSALMILERIAGLFRTFLKRSSLGLHSVIIIWLSILTFQLYKTFGKL